MLEVETTWLPSKKESNTWDSICFCNFTVLRGYIFHNIANGIKPGSDPKKTDKHVAECSKAVCWGVK